ncbi:hypothetical protein PIB30_051927 [Stylosanthes scabra]|uniref:Uncharacterized protein n=1 Tax=Stylosanthes scabra TaxID=79078 RepID=A0ABU6SJ30_9FABA|nr:hypothetical protein [Stylosanthes scabra]
MVVALNLVVHPIVKMAKKKVQEPESKGKEKKDKTIKRPDKRSDSRCTPLKFRKIYDSLSDAKKQLIVKMGLGAFAHFPDFYINHKLLMELVMHEHFYRFIFLI